MKRCVVVDLRDPSKDYYEDAEPVCGEAFCDGCGDCLACERGECYCGWASWVRYADR